MFLYGYQIVVSEACADTVQARRNRKKRINKKWRKKYGTRSVPWKKVIVNRADHTMIMHPKMWAAIKMELEIKKRKEGHYCDAF